MFAIDFAELLEQWGFGTVDDNILIDYVDTKKEFISISSSGGSEPQYTFDGDTSLYDDKIIIYCLQNEKKDAYGKLQQIEDKILKEKNIQVGNNMYLYFWKVSGISYWKRDEDNRIGYYLVLRTLKE